MLPLPGLSPIGAKKVIAQFDGGLLSSDAGVLVSREVEQRLRVAERMAACIVDPRAPEQITHTLADIICFRLLMIAGGYRGGNDANSLRVDPVFKMAHGLSPSERDLCSQSTISRLENLPDARALLRMGRAMIDLYCESFTQVPKRITLDIDDMFDAVHGGQQLRLFNAHYDEYGFQPIVVFDGAGRFVTAVLRPARRPGRQGDQGLAAPPGARHSQPLAQDRNPAAWRQPLLHAGDDRLLPRQRSRLHLRRGADLDVASTYPGPRGQSDGDVRGCAKNGKVRRFKVFFDGAQSWSRVERIVARVEAADRTSCGSRSKKSRVSPPERRGVTPRKPNLSLNPKPPLRTLAMPPVTKMRVGATENSRSHHQKPRPSGTKLKRCIIRASSFAHSLRHISPTFVLRQARQSTQPPNL